MPAARLDVAAEMLRFNGLEPLSVAVLLSDVSQPAPISTEVLMLTCTVEEDAVVICTDWAAGGVVPLPMKMSPVGRTCAATVLAEGSTVNRTVTTTGEFAAS